jgi:hypothetical protein
MVLDQLLGGKGTPVSPSLEASLGYADKAAKSRARGLKFVKTLRPFWGVFRS